MSEERMVEVVQQALDHHGIDDRIQAAGQFMPRGQTGGMFAGGLAGSEAGGLLGATGEAVGMAAGSLAGRELPGRASAMPDMMLVGVSERAVYGFAACR